MLRGIGVARGVPVVGREERVAEDAYVAHRGRQSLAPRRVARSGSVAEEWCRIPCCKARASAAALLTG